MKIIIFAGGIGNQLFQYCFYKSLQKKFGKGIYAVYYGNDHNGYELEKYFEVSVKKSYFCQLFVKIVFVFKYVYHSEIASRLCITEIEGKKESEEAIIYNGAWQNKIYLGVEPIRFKDMSFSFSNDAVRGKILSSNSIAFHIRRGDYLLPKYKKRYWHLENTDYYQKAVEYVQCKYKVFSFFVFSDDIEWCKANLALSGACYVGWNKGNDSIYDMYLMSLAKVIIIANSSFSFWAAYLNRRAELTIYPLRWYQEGCGIVNPDIFPEDWVGL